MAEFTFFHDAAQDRYTLHLGGDLVSVLDYRDNGSVVAMTRAYTIPSFRGHGYAGEVVARAVEALSKDPAKKIAPVCWYVAEWFQENPQYQGLLTQSAENS